MPKVAATKELSAPFAENAGTVGVIPVIRLIDIAKRGKLEALTKALAVGEFIYVVSGQKPQPVAKIYGPNMVGISAAEERPLAHINNYCASGVMDKKGPTKIMLMPLGLNFRDPKHDTAKPILLGYITPISFDPMAGRAATPQSPGLAAG